MFINLGWIVFKGGLCQVPLRSSGREILRHWAGVLTQIKITTAYFLLFKLDGLKRFKAEALQRSTPDSRDSE